MFPVGDRVARTHEPYAVWSLMAVNVAIFAYQQGLTAGELEAFLRRFALVPARYFVPGWGVGQHLSALDVSPFLTNTFLHGGTVHILGNLWTLWIFGPALEDKLRPARFLALYLASGVAASLAHALFHATSTIPTLGASGAIAGVIAAYASNFPYAWIRVLVPVFFVPVLLDVPALAFAGLWLLLQVAQGTTELLLPAFGAGIAWWAHAGGFLAGWVLARLIPPPTPT